MLPGAANPGHRFRAFALTAAWRPLLVRLSSSSAEFRTRWNRLEVRAAAPRVRQCRHPATGRIDLRP
ncbi:MAG: hypothetical protein ACLPUO_01885 [Streptosporangiaceae bacterium]